MTPENFSATHSNKTSAKALRNTLREKRRQLTASDQEQHSTSICQTIIDSTEYQDAQHIALYLSADGEVDLEPLLRHIALDGKYAYLPVILDKTQGMMAFAAYGEQTVLKKNNFGILEPEYQDSQLKSAQQLDLVLAPLVAFDDLGNRLGMGGGFYDRALQHMQANSAEKPIFMGIAHALQKVTQLESQAWDIKLNGIVTEKAYSKFL
ncbi:5-formyltetrahydrofolate cyclo-ligase [sulfur-oxidizing endosymbiont of Gigantopelta aegis]|uniref:5-formyltetrahydrofolate cyclo-ligase n=1 Tax=sulfur-oxidizing endosymbiont of Gigantopelta aegis TaxID=2794934 RepID=UPI001BE438A7|nr:5-formyltetrahydrofolate cyclo-ligase [sulfur-oxidizing endosymbiont of Gigantopelta aegis]